jgi:hypothetical protein
MRRRSFNHSSLDDGTGTKFTGATNGTLDASEHLSQSAGNVTVKTWVLLSETEHTCDDVDN